ncbi:hypothetical protein [Carboxylicivirga caseinilyticus]|uniref:hypothetical protein n=1 Tax=Carboxylicivirga caseinilyticus TaxID=3417572 RepID=UPI003D344B6F|nr:hypothetical protein [Marinilabiliaceae bacterium A049]
MNSYRKIFSIILLAVYSVVFAHNIIPHHHHYEGGHDSCDVQTVISQQHSHSSLCDHHHDIEIADDNCEGETHHVCEFDVKPVVNNELSFTAYYLVSQFIEFNTPENQNVKTNCQYYPQKLLESYRSAVPLRAPPYIS